MTGIVVADAGPLIALSRIDRLALLNALYGPVAVPAAVFSELRVDSDRPGARALSAAFARGAIESRPLATGSEDALARMSRALDPGEASAILLAEQLQARFLLMDERRGRQVARARGIPVVGVAGVLLAAKRSGFLGSVGAALAELSRHRYGPSDALVQEVLRLAGELD